VGRFLRRGVAGTDPRWEGLGIGLLLLLVLVVVVIVGFVCSDRRRGEPPGCCCCCCCCCCCSNHLVSSAGVFFRPALGLREEDRAREEEGFEDRLRDLDRDRDEDLGLEEDLTLRLLLLRLLREDDLGRREELCFPREEDRDRVREEMDSSSVREVRESSSESSLDTLVAFGESCCCFGCWSLCRGTFETGAGCLEDDDRRSDERDRMSSDMLLDLGQGCFFFLGVVLLFDLDFVDGDRERTNSPEGSFVS